MDIIDFSSHRVEIEIHMPYLEELELSGATNGRIDGFNLDRLKLDLSGANKTTLTSNIGNLDINLEGASSLELIGKGNSLNADISGASQLKAFNYQVDNATLNLDGICKAQIMVDGQLDVDASGASKVTFRGNANVRSDISGASSLKRDR
ncbi:MAG: DUF2807 domain-containing protein [Bacteroidetes bacterium]|nr:DUF2807 domain-containing protein [Bacteroidota bacterium]